MLNWRNKPKQSISHGAANDIPCCRFGSRPHVSFHQPAVPRKLTESPAMAFTPAFARVLTECKVPDSFQAWLRENSIIDKHFFLLGAPHGVDRDLIEPSGINLNVAERISVRFAFRVCKTACEDEERARIAAASSPGSADIPTETLQDSFLRRHAFVLPSKRMLSDELVKPLYHGYHKALSS